jgi:tetratricopeptide (TPR) repeat protein
MIDAGIMDRELALWLDEECGLTELSHQLLTLFQRGSQPGIFVDVILDYVNYCSREDRQKIEEVIKSSAGLSRFERQKKQGDYLLLNGRVQMAIAEYDRLLAELPETETALRPQLCHNTGVAYSRLFRFESAAKYFKKAYELSGQEESGIQYLLAERMQRKEGEYLSFLAQNGQYYELSLKVERLYEAARGQFEATRENRMLSALKIYKEEGNTASYYEEIDKIISSLKNDYRESVEQ